MHEWDYVPLSEPRVVAKLIGSRSRLDAAHYPKREMASAMSSAGVFPFSEPILATYIDLDRLIETCGLSVQQRKIVAMQMDGYTLGDIAEIMALAKQSVDVQFARGVNKIVSENNARWHMAMAYDKPTGHLG